MANPFELIGRTLDSLQQSHPLLAVPSAVLKRYGRDRAGQQAALVTFYGFLSVFPLLLLLVTFAGLFLRGTKLQSDIVNSALSQFPVIGGTLKDNLHAISKGNPAATLVSALGLLWGSLGVTNALQAASQRIWRTPDDEGPGLIPRIVKGLEILLALGALVVLSSVAAGASTIGAGYFGGATIVPRLLAIVVAILVNFVGYVTALWLLAPTRTDLRCLLPGAVIGAVGWTALQAFSGYLLGHQLHHASQIYGFFAVVLGLVFWINLGAQLFLLATETNLVLARHEWPVRLIGE